MRSTRAWSLIAFMFVVGASCLALAAPAPRVTVGTSTPGSLVYAVGDGLAKVVTDGNRVTMTVHPYSGTRVFIPLLDSGELQFAVMNAVDVALAYRGPEFKIGGRHPVPPSPNNRPVRGGAPIVAALR